MKEDEWTVKPEDNSNALFTPEQALDMHKQLMENKKGLPYPWCHFPEKCSISGRCEKQFLKNGYNCGE